MATTAAPRPLALDAGRITAGAGAIALNAVGLLLLMIPLAVPPMLDRARPDDPTVVWIRPKPPEPKREPVKVEITRPLPRPAERPRPMERPQVQPMQATTSEPLEGDIVVPPGTGEPTDSPVVEPPADPVGPMQGARLEIALGPAPPYPREALREGLEGTVVLRLLVGVDGRPIDVVVERSSGHRLLDAAARRHVLAKWTFRPAMRDGRPVQAIGLLPVDFSLD